jgi:hypothetical protein
VKLEFEAFAANVVANDSIEAAFVARKAETVRAGGVKARRPAFYDCFDSLVRLPADSLCRCKPGDSFQRCDHLTHACCNAGQTERANFSERFTRQLEGVQKTLHGDARRDKPEFGFGFDRADGVDAVERLPWPGEVGGSLPLYAGGRDPDQWFAFALARSNPRKLLTLVTKSNAQRHGVVMWGDLACVSS